MTSEAAPRRSRIDRSPKEASNDYLRLLVAPPRDSDVLIADEWAIYKAPRHVMTLLEPLIETVAVLVIVTNILVQPRYDATSLSFLVLVLSGIVAWRWIKSRTWGWSALFWAVVTLYIVVTQNIDYLVAVPLVGLWFIARLGLKILRWWRYEVRYLTNRRIIEASGFLGLRVASMPVSRVTDLALNRPAMGELFGYANLRIESAGQDQSLTNMDYIVEPRQFHRIIVRLSTKPAEIERKDFIDVRPVRQIEKR